jgi:tetratricopeptide (TPR) repeat protein
VRIERVDDKPARAKRSSPRRQEVDVADVDFGGVPPSLDRKLRRRLAEAADAFEAERFVEADRLLASIDRLAPGVPEVLELRGLTFYRLGRWIRALGELDRFADLTGSVEQHPVRADCCRALRRWSRSEELWHELGEASPSPELIEEGRIVQAGGLADRGRLDEAIRLLERAPKPKRRPELHHLRRWYVLGDLYERTGDLARARRIFGDILDVEPELGDVAERAAALG